MNGILLNKLDSLEMISISSLVGLEMIIISNLWIHQLQYLQFISHLAQGMAPYFLGDGTVRTELDIELTWEEYRQMMQE